MASTTTEPPSGVPRSEGTNTSSLHNKETSSEVTRSGVAASEAPSGEAPSGEVPSNEATISSPSPSSTPSTSSPNASSLSTSSNSSSPFIYKEFAWYRLWVYDFVLWCFSVIFDCFFREIRPRGAFRLPRTGPVIFVAAPHANQFVDPIVLMNQVKRESQRRISFLIAAKSYKQRVFGFLSKCQLSIPVVRAQDNLKKGQGKIFIDVQEDPLLVRGKGTKFTRECMPRGLVALPQSLGASEVSEVISDTELRIRKEFKLSQQINTLLANGTSYKCADKVNQKDVYNMVFKHLSNGNCIGIFPEGGSHDRTNLLPLKAGVAIMALGAMDNDPTCNVKIVPCGMNYFNAHKFRSRAVVEFGHPIDIPMELVKKYSNPETNRESVKELLDIVTTGLKAVTVTCDDFETLMVVQAARRLYAGNFAQHLPLPLIVEMNRRLVLGYQTFKDKAEIQSVKSKILKYNELLQQLYLPDHDVEHCDESNKLRVVPVFVFRLVKLIIFFTLSLPGATLFSPVFISSKIISTKKAKTALANSTVKIKANDVIATWKILIAMGIAPIVYSFYASVGTYYCYTRDIFRFRLVFVWLILYICGVIVTYSALISGEQGMDLLKSLRPLYLSVTSGSSITEVKKLRNELSEEITYLVNTFGPELFPNDFNLLELKNQLNITGEVNYVDSDEEEDRKTEELRNRRMKSRKHARRAAKQAAKESAAASGSPEEPTNSSNSALSLGNANSSSVSDGISLMNSDNSLTNIPMFSDYSLHKNANNPNVTIEQQSALNSTVNSSASIYDDYHVRRDTTPYSRLSREGSHDHIELNFGARVSPKKKLTDKIKNRIRESRNNQSSG
ncbi:uncharacterized protein CANTADRAFT_57598 [Suhomyces tanzawaensis NRRL Y-17324]|uniref:Phospholipid/glycerol acyltransferase domain-containing protein n=1 Tax=Suhomyces tanzawaensis NRRL Y-17324 TaxID=984487 RepID=A0A1E4SBB0_9ASCO|nr:uncharacterized protein CANTADRAFT_57598 [Suhomyces tanzawaensis NRRL Y-17324]ODV76781.1 hypothetical protein CANTADRAFT_57598 [Suhomyces tanzawaensis NRRL Y-17324]